MNFSEAESRVYELQHGDILVVEASGSAGEVGKSSIYRDELAGACFQNTLLRVRPHEMLPEYVHAVLLSAAWRGDFRDDSRGVGINHLGRARLAALRIVLLDSAEQELVVGRLADVHDAVSRLENAMVAAQQRSVVLRRAVLHAAFTGRLTGRSYDDEVVEELAAL